MQADGRSLTFNHHCAILHPCRSQGKNATQQDNSPAEPARPASTVFLIERMGLINCRRPAARHAILRDFI
jgi:hypothetical protein